jgi:hypothetical protein
MTVKEYLTEQGVSEADQTTYLTNPALVKSIEGAIKLRDEGTSAKTAAETLRQEAAEKEANTRKWWENEAQPTILKNDTDTASARAEAARLREHLKALKEKGYDIPDAYFTATPPTTPPPVTPPANTRSAQDTAYDYALGVTNLFDLANEYQVLYGAPLPNAAGLLGEAKAAGRSLTDYVTNKFNFATKRSEREAAEKKKSEDAIRADERTKVLADEAKKHNPNTAPAIASKAAAVTERHKEGTDSWKTREGRNGMKAERLDRFKDVKFLQ